MYQSSEYTPLFHLRRLPLDQLLQMLGRATAQVAGHRLSTAATQDRSQASSCGICYKQIDIGTDFLRPLQFPLPILSH
jgi:hypothetical protein